MSLQVKESQVLQQIESLPNTEELPLDHRLASSGDYAADLGQNKRRQLNAKVHQCLEFSVMPNNIRSNTLPADPSLPGFDSVRGGKVDNSWALNPS